VSQAIDVLHVELYLDALDHDPLGAQLVQRDQQKAGGRHLEQGVGGRVDPQGEAPLAGRALWGRKAAGAGRSHPALLFAAGPSAVGPAQSPRAWTRRTRA
jgi:hypothetical protein